MPDRTPRILLAVTADVSVPFLAGVARHLAGTGWDVHVVCSDGPNSRALASVAGVQVHHVAMSRDPAPVPDLVALARLVRLVRRVRPDVVSTATPKAGLLVGLAAAVCRVPARVYQLWGLRYETTGGVLRRVLFALERLSVAAATHVVSVSASLRDAAARDGLAPAQRITVIGSGSSHGVDLERFATTDAARETARRSRWGAGADVPVVGFVGRLHPDKGIDTLLGAVDLLSARGTSARLLLVGGAEGAEGALDALGATGWDVETTGHVDDVGPYLRLMDVLCLPSRREGFPNVVLEAAAAGVPCVTTPATGTVDAVVDGVTGLVAADHEPGSLARSLEQVLSDDLFRRGLGEAARKRVGAEFDQHAVWEGYARYYLDAAGRR